MKQPQHILLVLLILAAFGCTRNELVDIVDDGIPPSQPVGLNVYLAYDGQIGIEWEPNRESDIRGYIIFRSTADSLNFSVIDTTSDSYYFDFGLNYATTYFYRISALDRAGFESRYSEPVWAKPENLFRPGVPLNFVVNARNRNDSLSVVLFWHPPFDTDIAEYEIYRSKEENFVLLPENLAGISSEPRFTDDKNLELLTTYFYKLLSVDRGGLKSRESDIGQDLILNPAELISPADDSEIKPFNTFQIKTCSAPADYKIIVQTDPNYGTVGEIAFKSSEIDRVINVTFNAYFITPFRKYYWRVLSFTSDSQNPNSVSGQRSFTVVAQ